MGFGFIFASDSGHAHLVHIAYATISFPISLLLVCTMCQRTLVADFLSHHIWVLEAAILHCIALYNVLNYAIGSGRDDARAAVVHNPQP